MTFGFALFSIALFAAFLFALSRANELFFLEIRDGEVRVARGRLPQGLLDDIVDVLRTPPRVMNGELQGVSASGRVRIHPKGDVTEAHCQRLRNVLGQWPVTRVRNANRAR